MAKLLPATAMTRSADYKRTYHHVDVDPTVSLSDILTPKFWAHHVARVQVNDIVDVVATDGSLDVQLRAVDKGVGFVSFRVLRQWLREDKQEEIAEEIELPDLPEGYVVNHAPKTGWRVFTTEPHLEVSRGHKSKYAAHVAATEHAKKATVPTI
ncbi:hypothetical protein [Brucella anthropi]|uniref:hypothetical protein n=1 Tax=Brucella anthropi TaxID=529 RepID=UPI003D98B980